MRVLLFAIAAVLVVAGAASCRTNDDPPGTVRLTVPAASPGTFTTAPPRTPAATSSPRPRRTVTAPRLRTAGCGMTNFTAGTTVAEFDSAEGSRDYRLHIPPGYSGRRAVPVVLNFHGYAQNAEQQEAYSGLDAVSDKEGFILVTPEGSGDPEGWDIVGVYNENGVDDVQFVVDLVQSLSDSLCLDANRIFATGHSNGAEMASQLACDVPGMVAAIAPVSGAEFQDCTGVGVPVIAFQGTDDFNVPYEDSADAVQGWADHNGCGLLPDPAVVSEHVSKQAWAGCSGGDVVFYTIDGGGHTWPGADPSLGGVGETTDEINASALMWQFFAAHPKKE